MRQLNQLTNQSDLFRGAVYPHARMRALFFSGSASCEAAAIVAS
jgi:hypothetical protein